MLQDILLKIEQMVKNNNIVSDKKTVDLLNLLKFYKTGEYLYPGVLMSKLNLKSDTAYKLLRLLENDGILSKSYEMYCGTCSEFKGKIFDSFADVPDSLYCHECNRTLDPIEDLIVIYKVLKDRL